MVAQTVRNRVESYFDDWSLYEQAWLFVFVALNVAGFLLTSGGSLLGLGASVTGIVTVVLVAKGRISNYYFGIVNILLYVVLAWNQQYYGEVMLNAAYFLPMQFIGLYQWKRNQSGTDQVAPAIMSNRKRIAWLGLSIVGILAYGFFLDNWITALPLFEKTANLPYFDATSTVLSVIAMYLMVQRYKEQWYAWIVIDVVSIYMWLMVFGVSGSTGLNVTIMWVAYLVNAVYGLWNWSRMESEVGA